MSRSEIQAELASIGPRIVAEVKRLDRFREAADSALSDELRQAIHF